MSKKIKTLCCIFNYAPHYRLPIYEKIDKECAAHFYFGNRLLNKEHIAKLDYTKLEGFKRELNVHSIKLGRATVEYTSGWLKLAVNPNYTQYIITPNQYALNQWLFLLICFVLRKEVYVWMHGLKSSRVSSKSLSLWKMYDFFLKGSFLYGNYARDNMIRLGFDGEKLHLIYNSLNFESSKNMRQVCLSNPYKSYFKNDYPILVFIGRLTVVKKLHMILHATDMLKERGVLVNIVFIGDGPEMGNLQRAIAADDSAKYWFVGALYDEREIARYLFYADLCVSPGNVGLTGIHALSYGLPVITNDNFEMQMPEFEAIEPGRTGDFFKEDDVCNLADKIDAWLKENLDREAVRKRCYEVVDTKYNPNYQIHLIKSILNIH